MGLLTGLFSQNNSEDLEEYIELDSDQLRVAEDAKYTVKLAEFENQRDLMDVKDALYNGDLVILDIHSLQREDIALEQVVEDLRRVCNDTGGDIVQKGNEQIIITPREIAISREKIGE